MLSLLGLKRISCRETNTITKGVVIVHAACKIRRRYLVWQSDLADDSNFSNFCFCCTGRQLVSFYRCFTDYDIFALDLFWHLV